MDFEMTKKTFNTVTCEISTRGRVMTTLPLAVMSIAMQTVTPEKLYIIDDTKYDNAPPNYTSNWLWRHILNILTIKQIEWYFLFGEKIGQVANHQYVLANTDTDLIWRVDDDNYCEPNTLEVLKNKINSSDSIGAVGQNVWHPDRPILPAPSFAKNKMTKGIFHQVIEWFVIPDNKDRNAEHLYSTYLYRRDLGLQAGGYPQELSPVGHHEETIFSHKIYRLGYELLVTPSALVWHLRNPEGGIRDYQNEWLWKHDQLMQDIYMMNWGYKDKPTKFFVMTNGIGDQYCFKSVMKEIISNFKNNYDCVICTELTEIFEDERDVHVITLQDYDYWEQNYGDKYNPYRVMEEGMHLSDAFKKLYFEVLK